jgi:hypothetical protein
MVEGSCGPRPCEEDNARSRPPPLSVCTRGTQARSRDATVGRTCSTGSVRAGSCARPIAWATLLILGISPASAFSIFSPLGMGRALKVAPVGGGRLHQRVAGARWMRATSSLTQEEAPPLPLGSFYLGVKGVGCGRGGAFPQHFEGKSCSLNADPGKPSPVSWSTFVFESPRLYHRSSESDDRWYNSRVPKTVSFLPI